MIHHIWKEISQIPDAKIKEFKEIFKENPNEILDFCQVVTIQTGTRFIIADEDISTIWILLSGKVKALEEYATGEIYTFQKFPAPEVFGEMEALSDISKFRASLITESKCTFITLPVNTYIDFLKNHSQYLYRRTRITLKRVLDEQKQQRIYLMLKAIDRIKIYLIQHYKLNIKNNLSILKITRGQMAEETGYAVKTVNRVMKKLEGQNLLKIKGQRIIITEKQYNDMVKSVENFMKF
ncbi:Crp/Fnr family transcriptional regulator [Irregularibacter muris]|uniref:Crp/Fnr family transcriptional regulator n=1 Tax=Irregularibacter muris TaxID=1796619 RepID=A0AAE3L474_9FIRM|nr:Crp/Fnr family transcriptional regulator [Irregularibacter muris]MCR1899553.1 Crp/Fnr family transcriptional regulator [Irregularibacter muris]